MDVKIFTPEIFSDNRGELFSLWKDSIHHPHFIERRISISKKNTIRGFHTDLKTTKFITCLHGELRLILISKTNDQIETYDLILNDTNKKGVIVPPKYFNAHLCLSEKCILFYDWSNFYEGPENQIGFRWNDPEIGIQWGVDNPILSERDQNLPLFKDINWLAFSKLKLDIGIKRLNETN